MEPLFEHKVHEYFAMTNSIPSLKKTKSSWRLQKLQINA